VLNAAHIADCDPFSQTFGLIPFSSLAGATSEKLGSGCFGDVFLAKYNGTSVAVKRVGGRTSEASTLEREYRTLASIPPHENVVRLYGVCSDNAELGLLLVMEYCQLGSLKVFLADCPQVEACGALCVFA
jgi:serine/threonine protein kinase